MAGKHSFTQSRTNVFELRKKVLDRKITVKQAIERLSDADYSFLHMVTWGMLGLGIVMELVNIATLRGDAIMLRLTYAAAPALLTLAFINIHDIHAILKPRYYSRAFLWFGLVWFALGCVELLLTGIIPFACVVGPFIFIAGVVYNRMAALLNWRI